MALQSPCDRFSTWRDISIMVNVCFNLPGIKWGDLPLSSKQDESRFCAFVDTCGLKQINKIPLTLHENILDLVLTNTPYLYSDVAECDSSLSSDHAVVTFQVNQRVNLPEINSRLIYDYKRTNVNGLIKDLCDTELSMLVQHAPNINDAWTEWLEAVDSCIERNVPKRVVKHSKGPPWVDHELRSLQKAKLKAHRRAKRSEKVSDRTAYRKLRNTAQSTSHKKHKSFIQELGLSVKTSPKKFWSYVKSKTGSGVMPQDMFLKGEKVTNP